MNNIVTDRTLMKLHEVGIGRHEEKQRSIHQDQRIEDKARDCLYQNDAAEEESQTTCETVLCAAFKKCLLKVTEYWSRLLQG